MCHFWAHNDPIVLNNFFCYKPLLLLSCTYLPFSLCKTKKRVMRMHLFRPIMVHLPQINFFLENYWYYSHIPISHFHCAKFKKNSSCGSRIMRVHNFWAQNGPFPQIRSFSEILLMSLVSFVHAYLHAKNQSQILIY